LIAAGVFAVVGTLILVSFVRNAEDRELEGEELVEVLVLTEDVPAGTPSENLTASIEVEKVPLKVVSEGAVSSLDQLAGLVSSVDLLDNEQLTSLRFVTPERFAPVRGSVEVPDGLVEAAISVGSTQTVGAVLQPGDKVTIASTFDGVAAVPGNEPGGQTAGILMQDVLVTNVQGDPLAEPDPNADVGARAPAPNSGLIVTVAVTANEFERLTFVSAFGAFHLALQTDDDPVAQVNVQTGETIFVATS
jgi:pilus assembly protein CpaB